MEDTQELIAMEAPQVEDEERAAFIKLDPPGFWIRHPPKPHELSSFYTKDEDLFQTIHMGPALIDPERWKLVVTGLVKRSFAIDLPGLRKLPSRAITAFHECYGSPLKPATEALWRVGNVRWTGVALKDLLSFANPLTEASYVWSEGLDRGKFAGVSADRYQKDLPIDKAWQDEVLVAYEINGKPLSKERGGPVRLVVPGWFGTNSTKWLSKISLQASRAPGPYTTRFYNEPDPAAGPGATRPVWQVEPNSMIVRPKPDDVLHGPEVNISGWTWHYEEIKVLKVSVDGGESWLPATVEPRIDFSWQAFKCTMHLTPGDYTIIARATAMDGARQPLQGRRNHCHAVSITVSDT